MSFTILGVVPSETLTPVASYLNPSAMAFVLGLPRKATPLVRDMLLSDQMCAYEKKGRSVRVRDDDFDDWCAAQGKEGMARLLFGLEMEAYFG